MILYKTSVMNWSSVCCTGSARLAWHQPDHHWQCN